MMVWRSKRYYLTAHCANRSLCRYNFHLRRRFCGWILPQSFAPRVTQPDFVESHTKDRCHQCLDSGGGKSHGALTCNSTADTGKLSPSGLQVLAIWVCRKGQCISSSLSFCLVRAINRRYKVCDESGNQLWRPHGPQLSIQTYLEELSSLDLIDCIALGTRSVLHSKQTGECHVFDCWLSFLFKLYVWRNESMNSLVLINILPWWCSPHDNFAFEEPFSLFMENNWFVERRSWFLYHVLFFLISMGFLLEYHQQEEEHLGKGPKVRNTRSFRFFWAHDD